VERELLVETVASLVTDPPLPRENTR
jgi:hypothetical protein